MKIMVLGGQSTSTDALVNALHQEYGAHNVFVVLEQQSSRIKLLLRRVKRLGLFKVINQVAFMVLGKVLARKSSSRVQNIVREYQLDLSRNYAYDLVPTVNSRDVYVRYQAFQPDVVVVNGTRILSRETIGHFDVPLLNLHVGYTPNYRGVHGGYWALYQGRKDLVATTLHFIDSGIDTGAPIKRQTFGVTPEDNFTTYPYLHTSAGIQAVITELNSWQKTRQFSKASASAPSQLFSHPTLTQYVRAYFKYGVK